MGLILQPDDFHAGMFLTVLGTKKHTQVFTSMLGETTVLEPDDALDRSHDLCGKPLRLLAWSLPYVVVADPCGHRRTLDMRSVVFSRVSKKFVKALAGSEGGPSPCHGPATDMPQSSIWAMPQ